MVGQGFELVSYVLLNPIANRGLVVASLTFILVFVNATSFLGFFELDIIFPQIRNYRFRQIETPKLLLKHKWVDRVAVQHVIHVNTDRHVIILFEDLFFGLTYQNDHGLQKNNWSLYEKMI